jgi:rubrerythrin
MAFYITCLSVIEFKTSFIYNSLSEKTQTPLSKSLLLSIAQDSAKHSTLLEGVSKSISPLQPKREECEKNLGQTWPTLNTLISDLEAKADSLSSDELYEKLLALESIFGEEYVVFIQMQTLRFMTKEINQIYSIDLDNLKQVFESIVKDEEHHREILAQLRETNEPVIRDIDNTPLVRYKSPDRWIDYSSAT